MRFHRATTHLRAREAGLLALGVASLWILASAAAASGSVDSCNACHRDPDLLVKNKKLYDYFQQWDGSIHQQEGVDCVDCHGGNADESDKDRAHGKGVGGSDPASGVYYKNIIETCGQCHEDIHDGFLESHHYEHLVKKEQEQQGPTCVTCHGAIDPDVLNVNSVATACARCHNEEHDNHPDIPEKAKGVLNRFLSINRFYRYITIRAEPEAAKAFFEELDPRMRKLSITWHSFDLEAIDEDTKSVLETLKSKRNELRKKRAEKQ